MLGGSDHIQWSVEVEQTDGQRVNEASHFKRLPNILSQERRRGRTGTARWKAGTRSDPKTGEAFRHPLHLSVRPVGAGRRPPPLARSALDHFQMHR